MRLSIVGAMGCTPPASIRPKTATLRPSSTDVTAILGIRRDPLRATGAKIGQAPRGLRLGLAKEHYCIIPCCCAHCPKSLKAVSVLEGIATASVVAKEGRVA